MSREKLVQVPRDRYPQPIYPDVIGSSGSGYEQDEIHLLDYWRIIANRRWLILAIFLTAVMTTLIYTLEQTPVFQATTRIQIDRENPNILSFKDVYEIETSTDDTLRTQFEVLKSKSLARRVIEDLKVATHPEFMPKEPGLWENITRSLKRVWATPTQEEKNPFDPLRPLVNAYLARLHVTPVRQARLADVSFESADPELAARIVNAHARHFIEQNLQYKVDATQEASDFLDKNLVTLRGTLEKAEERLQAYSRENEILFTEEGKNTASEKLRQLEEEYTRAQADRFQKESYDRLIGSGNTDSLPQVMTNALIVSLTTRLAELQREEAQASVTFGPAWPLRSRILSQIDQVRNSLESQKAAIVNTVRAEHAAAVEREKLLSVELAKQTDAVKKMNQDIIQYTIYKRDVDSIRHLYDGLSTRLKEAGVSAGLKASNIRVVDRAEVPQTPVRPRKALNLFLSAAIGLLLGVGCAFAQEYFDSSLKTPEDVTRYLRAATLGMVPKLESLEGKRGQVYSRIYGYRNKENDQPVVPKNRAIDRIAFEQPHSLMSEAYRSIRTSLLLSSSDRPPKTILVTSAAPSEGKTVTAINLAISLTQTGAKVVLIDADMRKPRVHGVFSLGVEKGLSGFLAGTTSLKEVIYETDIQGLLVIPCGVTPPNPSELILSNRFRRMLEALQNYFDYIVVDSPPIAHVSDARILATTADSTVLVIKAFSTSRHQAQFAFNQLVKAHGKIGGIVLNDIDVRERSGYAYSYPYYRHYRDGA